MELQSNNFNHIIVFDDIQNKTQCFVAQFNKSEQYDQYPIFSFAVNGVMMTLIGTLGMFGNALIIYLLRKNALRAKINGYFIVLAIWDFVVCLFSSILWSPSAFIYGRLPMTGTILYSYVICLPIASIARTGSAWTLTATGIERYLAICHPLRHKKSTDARRRHVIILTSVAIIAIIFNVPKFLEMQLLHCNDKIHNKTQHLTIWPTEMRQNKIYQIIYNITLELTMVTFGPAIIQVLLMVLISRQMSIAQRNANLLRNTQNVHFRNNSKRERFEQSVTNMIILVELKFAIGSILPVAINIIEAVLGSDSLLYNLQFNYAYVIDTSNILVVINSALNLLLYISYCQRFRSALIRTLSSMCCSKQKHNQLLRRHAKLGLLASVTQTYSIRNSNSFLNESKAASRLLRHKEKSASSNYSLDSCASKHLRTTNITIKNEKNSF